MPAAELAALPPGQSRPEEPLQGRPGRQGDQLVGVSGAVGLRDGVVAPVDRGVPQVGAALLLRISQRRGDPLAVAGGEERLPDEVPHGVLPAPHAGRPGRHHEQHQCAGPEHPGRLAATRAGSAGRPVETRCARGGVQPRPDPLPRAVGWTGHAPTVARQHPRRLSQMMGSLTD